jgi:hypothetical protein
MTLEELKIAALESDMQELNDFVSIKRDEIKLLFSNLIPEATNSQHCIALISNLHLNRNNGIETSGIQFLLTCLANYFKAAILPVYVQTCISNLQDNVLKYRLLAWFQYKYEYTTQKSHVTRFSQYLEILSKAIADENEDYTDDVLSDLQSYYSEFSHVTGFHQQFQNQDIVTNFPILGEFNRRRGCLDYIVELHEAIDKIFTPSVFTEKLFADKFINYIRLHHSTVWNTKLLGYDNFTIRSEIINFGQANFDKSYNELLPSDVVKLYCYFNMRKHYYSSLYLFERCSWIQNLINQKGCLKFIDLGCGPATSGVAMTDYLLSSSSSKQNFDYIGIDCYKSMISAALDMMDNPVYNKCTIKSFKQRLADLEEADFINVNSILINTCYLFSSPSLNVISLASEINGILSSYNQVPRFLLFQNTTDESKNINYTLFKSKLIHYEILLSDKVTIKYNNQRNSFYQPVHESVYFEVLKF